MLRELTVKNFALVEELNIGLSPGLTVITGESGAGKSILLDALGLVLGDRAARRSIRPGTESCEVTADFDIVTDSAATNYLTDQALVDQHDPGRCLIRRVTTIAGRSRAFVNTRPVNLGTLQEICRPLIDLHSQDEHRSLLQRDVQLTLLDDYGVETKYTEAVRSAYLEWQKKHMELSALTASSEAACERMDLLRYQVDELDLLKLAPGETEELEKTFKRLSTSSDRQKIIGSHITALDTELIPQLARLTSDLENIDDDHSSLSAGRELAQNAQVEAEETKTELRAYLDAIPIDPAALAHIEERLEVLHDIARKHRVNMSNLAAHAKHLAAELKSLEIETDRLAEMSQLCTASEQVYREASEQLGVTRASAADAFSAEVTKGMADLGMIDASLKLKFVPSENERGLETVDFWVTTNSKYASGPLKQIASGGELARISLAIQLVAATRSKLPCLVLDEAEVGIGGITADVLGRMLRRLSKHTQVICVTHAPQIAAIADTHLKVAKTSDQDTIIDALNDSGRIEELARMLAGRQITPKTREYAKALMEGSI